MQQDMAVSTLTDKRDLYYSRSRIGKSELDFNAKHPILLHCKQHVVVVFSRRAHRQHQHEGRDYIRDIIQQR